MIYTPPPTGSLVLLTSVNVAAPVAVVDFTTNIDGTYDEYLLHIVNAVPATNGAFGYLRTSADAGVSFAAVATDYYTEGVNEAQIQLHPAAGSSNVADHGGLCSVVRMFNPAGTTHRKRFHLECTVASAANAGSASIVAGARVSLAAYNAVRFLFSAGNVATGKFKLFGVQK